MKKVLLTLVCDIVTAALVLTGIWFFNYQTIQPGVSAVSSNHTENNSTGKLVQTNVKPDTQDWHTKFADHFTDQVVSTDTSYTSPDLSIQLSCGNYDSHVLDTTNKGKHKKYGTNVSYVLADIYVGDISCIQTAFANDTYGAGYSEKLTDMSDRIKSVLAVNGDSYNNNRHQNNGTIIRNGIIYRAQSTDMETCVLNWDGSMKI